MAASSNGILKLPCARFRRHNAVVSPDSTPHARLREPKGGVIGQLAPVNRKRGQKPVGRGPEPTKKRRQGKRGIAVAVGDKSRD